MEAKPNRSFPRIRSAREQGSVLGGKILKHLTWAAGVAGKFKLRQSRTGWNPQGFIYAGTQRWFVLPHVLQRLRLSHQRFDLGLTINLHQEAILAGRLSSSDARTLSSRQSLSGPSTTVSFIPSWLPVEKNLVRSGPAHAHTESRAPVLRWFSGSSHTAPVALSFLRLQQSEKSGDGRDPTVVETGSIEVGARILRKLRRIEVRPSYQSAEADGTFISGKTPSRDFVVESSAPKLPPKIDGKASSETVPSALPTPMINMGEITNEVMRQLDSRLVATRERMGKI
jgi:hypothetical protein